MNSPFLLRAATAALLIAGMSGLGATAAFADDVAPDPDATTPAAPAEPAPAPEVEVETPATAPAVAADPTPYKLLAWKLPCGVADRFCAPGEILAHVIDLETPSLDAFDRLLADACGDWQIDLEWDSPTTTALIAVGVLTAPNVPLEDHAFGSLGEGVSPYKDIENADCVQGAALLPEEPIAPTPAVIPAATAAAQPLTLAMSGSNSGSFVSASLALLLGGVVLMHLAARRRTMTFE